MTEMDKLYEREDIYDVRTVEELAGHYKRILELLGEDTSREGLLKTPERVAKAMAFLTKGYGEDPKEILLSAKFREDYRHMVVVKDIELYSMCEHHMLPFYGKAHVAYIPNGYITGLSKVARVVECFARRFSGAGAPDGPDSGLYSGGFGPDGRCGRHRGGAHLHADARHSEAELRDDYFGVYRGVPEESEYAARVPANHQQQLAVV